MRSCYGHPAGGAATITSHTNETQTATPSLTCFVLYPVQAPDPLWLAQRLVGAGLEVRTRPEYSYGRQFRGASMDSANDRLADSPDAVVWPFRFFDA